jgi:hypothetical protein
MPLQFRDVVDHSLFSTAAFRWRMGVRSLVADEWLQPDDLRSLDLLEKDLLTLRHPGQTFLARPDALSAAAEAHELVAAALVRRGLTMRDVGAHPLEVAGLSVQEDLCLMEARGGSWVLTAASVCFPTRWELPSKLGRSLAAIHDPVPDYGARLGERVERFFDRMTPGALAYRFNWSLVGESARRLDARARQAPTSMPPDPANDLFFRVERQTLRRLEGHEAIVFGIRIHVWPLGAVVSELPPEQFADEIETMPFEIARYKNLEGIRSPLASWLRRR